MEKNHKNLKEVKILLVFNRMLCVDKVCYAMKLYLYNI